MWEWAWSGSREQFLYCGLRKFCHSKSSVYRWYWQLDRDRFVYDTYRTTKTTQTRHCWVYVYLHVMFITHCPTVTLQLRNFDLFRTCRTSSFCTVAWHLARFQLTRRIARSLGDSFLLSVGWDLLWSAYIPNLKSVSIPVAKVWKAVQSVENGVVCGG